MFSYTPGEVSGLEACLSIERLQPYVNAAGGDKERALRLYERNTQLSEAFYGPMQAVEIVIRNALHTQLLKQFGPLWFRDLEAKGIVVKEQLKQLQQARQYLSEAGKPETAGKMVAELSFGFWVGICAKRYQTPLWNICLHRPFKTAGAKGKPLLRFEVFERLDGIRTLRNRVAHHEPILTRNLEEDFAQILATAGWISGAYAEWIEQTSCFRERFCSPLPPVPPPPSPETPAPQETGPSTRNLEEKALADSQPNKELGSSKPDSPINKDRS